MSSAKLDKSESNQIGDAREIVALSLNQQGYLFQHKIGQVLESCDSAEKLAHKWHVEAEEVPVSLPNGKETRIDLVLRDGQQPQVAGAWRVVLECKRSSPDYKRWVFFGDAVRSQRPSRHNYYLECAELRGTWNNQGDPPMMHYLKASAASLECPVFEYGVEARLDRPGTGKAASATDAIEGAFQQVTLGQAGLALRLRKAHELSFKLLPVVLTTAELMSADFAVDRVSLDRGTLAPDDLNLKPRSWLAVNYHVNDVICQFSGLTANRSTNLALDLATRQVRTVFVVQAAHVQQFLAWLDKYFLCSGR